ncbi:MAG: MarR family winged helix-turn-helix transcriptional regulator [Anaerolineales bacterium]
MEQDNKTSSPDGTEIRMLQLFQRIQKLNLSRPPLQEVDLSMSQMQVIRFVGENPNCHLQDLAEGLGVSSPTASVSIRRLEEVGLVSRQPDPDDGRATCLTLTKESQAAFEQVKRQMFTRMQDFLSYLTEKEQDQLFELMEKAVNGIEEAAEQTK